MVLKTKNCATHHAPRSHHNETNLNEKRANMLVFLVSEKELYKIKKRELLFMLKPPFCSGGFS